MRLQIRCFERSIKIPKRTLISISCLELLYFIYLIRPLYVVTNSDMIQQMLDILEWPLYFATFFSAVRHIRFSTKELIVITAVGLVFFLNYMISGYAELLKSVLLIVSVKDVEFRKIVKALLRVLAVSIALTCLLYLTGISDAGMQRRGAISLGYITPNFVGFVLLMLTSFILVLLERVGIVECGILLVINYLGYLVSNGRSAFLLAAAMLLGGNFVMDLLKKSSWFVKIFALMPIWCCIFTVVTAYLYPQNSFVQRLDPLFTSRIWMNYYIFSTQRITLFGHWVQSWLEVGAAFDPARNEWSTFMTADNVYTCLLIQMGLIPTLTVFAVYYKLICRLVSDKLFVPVLVMLVLAVYGIVESTVMSLFVCFPFFCSLSDCRNKNEKLGCVSL